MHLHNLVLAIAVAIFMQGISWPITTVPKLHQQALNQFIGEMADRHGFDPSQLRDTLSQAEYRPQIIALMSKSRQKKRWDEYRNIFLNPQYISGGLRFWKQNASSLDRARRRYGVPEEMISAIIGIETNYGQQTGRFKVINALTTLAFNYPPRSKLFRTELEQYLLLSRDEEFPLLDLKGSYAGAMGIAQFMPGSYRRYAVDFDRDGHRDLFKNVNDAIGSVANYFTAHGWRSNDPIAAPATVRGSGSTAFSNNNLHLRIRLDRLYEKGISLDGVYPGHREAIPLSLPVKGGQEFWLGFENFYVITRYNHSVYYAMAVYQLSETLRKRFDSFVTPNQ